METEFATELEQLISRHRNAGTDQAEIREALTKALDAEFDEMDKEAGDDEAEDEEEDDRLA